MASMTGTANRNIMFAAVHREDLVVEVGRQHAALRARQLQPHQHREHAAERQENEGGDDVAPADDLVVDRGRRAPDPTRRTPGLRPGSVGPAPRASRVSRVSAARSSIVICRLAR